MGEKIGLNDATKYLISKNIQTSHTTQQQKNKQPDWKMGRGPKLTGFPMKTQRWPTGTWKDVQHY